MTTDKMTYEEAMAILGVDETADSAELHTAYRVSSVSSDVDQSTLDAALDVIREHIKEHGVAKKGYDFGNATFNMENIHNAVKADKARKEKLDAKLPENAPADFKLARNIAQHFPYRLLLVGIFLLVCHWNATNMSLMSNLTLIFTFVITLANLVYPFITRPLRYFVIGIIDKVFHEKHKRAHGDKTIVKFGK